MVQRLFAPSCRFDIDFQVFDCRFLPDEIVKGQGPKRAVPPVSDLAICADYAVLLIQLFTKLLQRHLNQIIKRGVFWEGVIGGGDRPQGIGLTNAQIL